ncbi:hypothetical protein M3Y94_00823800 [Aphelenchoides besseyi]|nr:hypothetical protein M3Y94_00823800 [Aphelenchoides besseyi]KAI6227091.1 CAMK/CASK protein kinase [Aphelenchoides besseyi]
MRAQKPSEWIVDGEETALLWHHYQICDIIEKSPICSIYRAVHRNTSKTVTIKSLDLRRYSAASGLTAEAVEKEVEICATLKHPHFVQLRDVISGNNALHMIFECVDGLDICFEIVKRASAGFIYSESVASHYIRQLAEALKYLHDLKIVHRDIRPHNILLANKDNNAPLKIRGFGVAHRLNGPNDRCPSGRIGIPSFMSPEIVSGQEYGCEVDLWSAGILLCILLTGRPPFNGPIEQLYKRIEIADFSLESGIWPRVSDAAKDLVRKLLVKDGSKRLSAAQALEHPWLSDRTVPSKTHAPEAVEAIRRYNQRRQLKSNIIAAVNNSKWNRFPVHSFLSADSMPGGDACDSDYVPRDSSSASDMSGVEKVLASLDQISVLMDQSTGLCTPIEEEELQNAINNRELHEMLLLYDRIRNQKLLPSKLNQNAIQYLAESKNEIDGLLDPSAEARELTNLLHSTHFHAIIQAHDVIVEEVFGAVSNNSEFTQSTHEAPASFPHQQSNCVAQSPEHIISNQTGKPLTANGHLVQMVSDLSMNASTSQSAVTDRHAKSNIPPSSSNSSTSLHRACAIDVPGPSHRSEQVPVLYEDDDDDIVLNSVYRLRLVQFQKDTEEPMGITLKITEDGRCLVARIMHGGLIHRQGTLHVFDEIREINGVSVQNQGVEALQHMLREARGHVTFKIVPSYRSAPPACEIYVRAQFDYDPSDDDLIPCSEAGVPFKTGDILQIISKDDHNWYQARFVQTFPAIGNAQQTSAMTNSMSGTLPNAHHTIAGTTNPPRAADAAVAGLIPSPELQEWRTACLAIERSNKDNASCTWFSKRKKYYSTKYLRKHSELFDSMNLVTYEEVVRLSSFRRKTLVLLGAHGVGRRHIKNTLIHEHPQRFAYPIPHTTRPPRREEIDGKHYYFVPNDVMMADIQNNEYLEYGNHEECMYGTKLETIRAIHRTNKMAILDVEPQALKTLRTAEYSPFVVFIGAPNLEGLKDPDGSLEQLGKESEILRLAFGHLFDYVICNNDIDETIRQLELVVEKLSAIPQWVPLSWIY